MGRKIHNMKNPWKQQVVTEPNLILNFLKGTGVGSLGRNYMQMVNQTDSEWEHCTDAIQFIFPLAEESRMAHHYPLLSKEIVEKAKQSKVILDNLRLALERITKFFAIGPYENKVIQSVWCRDYNHNLLRITRIIRSLRLFGLNKEAQQFYDAAYNVGIRLHISPETIQYWDMAMNDAPFAPLQKPIKIASRKDVFDGNIA